MCTINENPSNFGSRQNNKEGDGGKVSLFVRCVGTRMKVHIADGVSSGEHFVHPLGEIREVLERYVYIVMCNNY